MIKIFLCEREQFFGSEKISSHEQERFFGSKKIFSRQREQFFGSEKYLRTRESGFLAVKKYFRASVFPTRKILLNTRNPPGTSKSPHRGTPPDQPTDHTYVHRSSTNFYRFENERNPAGIRIPSREHTCENNCARDDFEQKGQQYDSSCHL